MKTNRWLNGAIPAVGIHISIGAVYAWSVFTNPVMDALGVSLSQVSWIFSIAIFFLGMFLKKDRCKIFLEGSVCKFVI